MILRRTLLTVTLCLALAVPATAPADRASQRPGNVATSDVTASACPSSIRLGSRRYAYFQRRVNCENARRAVRRLYASYGRRGRPRGFRCRSRTRFRRNGACRNSTGTRYFGFSR